ncbi:hypothetical protein TNCV_1443301 [Trichonephila clavipes]|nr:hypothetical protein TNCV_1443301 [Trichonephila clavipes]
MPLELSDRITVDKPRGNSEICDESGQTPSDYKSGMALVHYLEVQNNKVCFRQNLVDRGIEIEIQIDFHSRHPWKQHHKTISELTPDFSHSHTIPM